MTDYLPFRTLVSFARGGGWGSDQPRPEHTRIAVMRGTDFAAVQSQRTMSVPRRWERDSKLPQRLLQPGDVVLEISGGSSARGQSTGRTIFISESVLADFNLPAIPASFCRVMRFATNMVDSRYAYYGLQDMYQSGRAAEYENQSTGISNFQFERFLDAEKLRLPPRAEQHAVVEVLSALDDNIAVNERIVRCCDELRTTTFGTSLTNRQESVVHCPLSSVADFVNGRAFTKDATGAGRMVIRIAEVNSGPSGSTVYNEIEVPDEHLARPGDLLFAWSGSLTVARWFRDEAIVNQHIFKVIPRDGFPPWLVFELILNKLAAFRSIAAGKATTMGHIQRRHLDEVVPVPSNAFVSYLDTRLGPLWDRALAAEQESLSLTRLRDTLLPRLMSGEIRVREAEKIVEEAT